MSRVLVAVPCPAGGQGGTTGDVAGFCATTALHDTFGIDRSRDGVEDAEHAALLLASVAALTAHGSRTVVLAEVGAEQVDESADSGNGEVTVRALQPRQRTAWFGDAPDVDVTALAARVHGWDVDSAWEDPDVQALLAEHDLLWHDITEPDPSTVRVEGRDFDDPEES